MARTCPLEVYEVFGRDLEVSGREVVLDGRVDLHDVTALAAHVDVHYPTQQTHKQLYYSTWQNAQICMYVCTYMYIAPES